MVYIFQVKITSSKGMSLIFKSGENKWHME